MSPAVRRHLIFTDVCSIFCHACGDGVLRNIIVLVLIKLWKFDFLGVVRIGVLVTLLAVEGVFRIGRVGLVGVFSVLFDFPDGLAEGLERVVMFVLDLLDLLVKSVILRNNI